MCAAFGQEAAPFFARSEEASEAYVPSSQVGFLVTCLGGSSGAFSRWNNNPLRQLTICLCFLSIAGLRVQEFIRLFVELSICVGSLNERRVFSQRTSSAILARQMQCGAWSGRGSKGPSEIVARLDRTSCCEPAQASVQLCQYGPAQAEHDPLQGHVHPKSGTVQSRCKLAVESKVVVSVLALEDGDDVGVVGGLLMLRHPMVG